MDGETRLGGRVPLNCIVYPGMFSTERKVVITVGEETYVTYVDQGMLTISGDSTPDGGIQAKIWVKIRQNLTDTYVVALPEETFSTGELIKIPKEMVALER